MLTAKSDVKETNILTKKECDVVVSMLEQAMYKNEKANVNLRFNKVNENHFQVFNDAEKDGDTSRIVIEGKISPADEKWGKDCVSLELNFAELNVNPETGEPVTDDWYAAFHSLAKRGFVAATVGSSTVIPTNAPAVAFELLNKSYYGYQILEDFKGPDGKTYKRPGKSFVKLSSSCKIDEKFIDVINAIPKAKVWLVLGKGKAEESARFMNVVDEKDLESVIGVKPTDIMKMWELVESRKILPIYPIGRTMEQCIETSFVLVEQTLAENSINPNFTKTNIIL